MVFDPDKFLMETGGPVPKQPIQPTQPGFDPDKFLAETGGPINQGPGIGAQAEAALQGFGQGATFGYLPQLQAGAEMAGQAIFGAPGQDVNQQLEAQGFTINQPEQGYVESRDAYLRRQEQLKEAAPVAFTAGEIGGALASSVPIAKGVQAIGKGVKLLGGATRAARFARAGTTGAITGLVRNPGDVEGEIGQAYGFQPEQKLKQAVEEGVTGLIFQGGSEVASSVFRKMAETGKALLRQAKGRAVSALGGTKGQAEKLAAKGISEGVGDTLLRKGIVKAGDSAQDIYQKALAVNDEAGESIGAIYKNISETVSDPKFIQGLSSTKRRLLERTAIDGPKFAGEIHDTLRKSLSGTPKSNKILKTIEKDFLEDLQSIGKDANIKMLHKFRRSLDESINFDKEYAESPALQRQLKKMRRFLVGKIEDRISAFDKVVGGDNVNALKEANKAFGHTSEAIKMVKKKLASESKNLDFGLRESLGSGFGATIGGTLAGPVGAGVGAISGAAISKAAKKYGDAILAQSALKVGQLLEANPASLSKFAAPLIEAVRDNPERYVFLVNTLLDDPEFVQTLNNSTPYGGIDAGQ